VRNLYSAPSRASKSPPDVNTDWRDVMCFCALRAFEPSNREADFIANMMLYAVRGHEPSPKQTLWLHDIYDRLRRTVKP
jgi:hypothetical protein